MLPLLRDRLQIVLTPAHVTLVRLGKGWKPRVVFNETLPCALPEAGEPMWRPALQAMQQLLQRAGAGKADAAVILSNHFVRYQRVEAQADLGSLDEEQGFVRFSFAETFGPEVDHLALRWSEGLDVAPQVASGIEQTLIDQMEHALLKHGATLASLQPYLMAAFNHVHKAIALAPSWFVLVEPGRICLALLRDGEWQSLHAARIGSDWASELPSVIAREFQINGTDGVGQNMLLCLPAYFDHKRLADVSQSCQVLNMTPQKLQQGTVLLPNRVGVKS